MTDTRITLPQDDDPLHIQTCRSQHQTWAMTIAQNEQEIDQLLAILSDLLDYQQYKSLRQRAVDYYGDLNHLKSRFQRLKLDMICEGVACNPSERLACREPRIGLYATLAVDSQLRSLMDELGRIKAGCYQFLSVMVTLNLF
ncbi:hypothetical protein [Spirosoma endbachense]|uniref:Uncharacterized protein n=1 Tax=Spirosoma endbachense TaxID=2666025 RepID=A0A6P1VQL2_9BACT|nr:hypothetical protein [Spirosoma endbachense]QHV95551.1 hypothetical protein GJR95_11295 [Spirosoma endbachense]